MLDELSLVEQRSKAFFELPDGATVVGVAGCNEVARQTVRDRVSHDAASGLTGLAEHSSKPETCAH